MKVVNNASLKDIFNTSIYDFNNFKKDKLHEICPYTAMFPPKLANSLIENYSTTGQTVYDPFSGRGTTLLQSRLLNRKAYASDLNPLALVLSKAKSKKISINLINKRINELEKTYANSKKIIIDYLDYEYMKTYFSDEIYNQLIFVKNLIGINWKNNNPIDTFILSCILGIIHGPTRKDGTSMFLSVGMSNTNAMSKNYVDKYVLSHNLKFPTNNNLFDKIRYKISKISKTSIQMANNAKFKMFDALKCNLCFNNIKFDLILTSPPYLNIYSYTRENWIRLWLLGFKREGISNAIKLDDSHKYEQYKEFLIKFMNSAGKTLSDNGKLILVIGDVEGQYNFKTLWDEIKYNVHFEMVDNFQDNKAEYKSTRKNGTKAGKATRIDNICIFKKWK